MKEYRKKLAKNIGILAVIIILVIGIGYQVINRKVDITNDIVVTYTGFNGGGTLSYNSSDIHKRVVDIIGKKNNVNSSELEKVENGKVATNQLSDKAKKTLKQAKEIKVTFSESKNLRSGQKIKLIVTTPKKSPIKSKVQTIKVKKLEKFEKLNANDFKDELVFKESGYDGLGYINAISKKIPDQVPLLVVNNGHLKNNGFANVIIPKATIQYMANHGMKLVGSPEFKVSITDLQELQGATNLDKVVSLDNKYAQNGDQDGKKQDDNRKLELIHTYATTASESQQPSEVSETVTINKNLLYNDSLSIFGLYKVATTQKGSSPVVKYEIYGFDELSFKNNEINITGKVIPQDGFYQALDGSEEDIINQIKTYASLVI